MGREPESFMGAFPANSVQRWGALHQRLPSRSSERKYKILSHLGVGSWVGKASRVRVRGLGLRDLPAWSVLF